MAALVVEPMSVDKIRMAQEDDIELQDLRDRARQGEANEFYIIEGGSLQPQLCGHWSCMQQLPPIWTHSPQQ
jgi:hypothetical protein